MPQQKQRRHRVLRTEANAQVALDATQGLPRVTDRLPPATAVTRHRSGDEEHSSVSQAASRGPRLASIDYRARPRSTDPERLFGTEKTGTGSPNRGPRRMPFTPRRPSCETNRRTESRDTPRVHTELQQPRRRFRVDDLLLNPALYCERWYPRIRQPPGVLIAVVYVILKVVAPSLLPAA